MGSQAWSSQVVIANKVIIQGEDDFLLVYDGTPALGNLIASIASMGGTDDFGNEYMMGVTAYSPAVSGGVPTNHAQLQDGSLSIGPGVDFVDGAVYFVSGQNDYTSILTSPTSTTGPHITDLSVNMAGGIPAATTGTAGACQLQVVDFNQTAAADVLLSGNSIPTDVTGVALTSQTANMASGFTSLGLTYKIDDSDNLQVWGGIRMTAASGAAGAAVVTLGSATRYHPTVATRDSIGWASTGSVAKGAGIIQANTDGTLSLLWPGPTAAGDRFDYSGIFPLGKVP